MARISLLDMRFYAFHGVYEEERKVGTWYLIDVDIDYSTTRAAMSDDLRDTLNYESVYTICRREMRIPRALLESVVERIGLGIRYLNGNISELTITLRKQHPPLGGSVQASAVTSEAKYSKKCGRCNRPLLCYSDQTCWCMDTQTPPKILESLKMQFGDSCLCKSCLEIYSKNY